MKKHILIVCMHFHPVQFRVNDIAYELVERGYQVTVVTGIPNYPQGKFNTGYSWFKNRREKYKGVDIIRIPIIPRGNNSFSLILNYYSFLFFGFFFSILSKVKADHVFIYGTSPLLKANVGLRYAHLKKIPSTLYVMDLWPDSIQYAGGIDNKQILSHLSHVMKRIYQKSTTVLTSSKSYIPEIMKLGIEPQKIEFWPQYAESFYNSSNLETIEVEIIKDERLNLIFAGTIGIAQGLEILIDTSEELKIQNILVRFILLGDGRAKTKLLESIENRKLSDYFQFIDKKPASMMPYYFAQSDAALLTLLESPLFEKTIPAKLQSYMAYGIPVLASATGEVANIIAESGCGFASNAGDPVGYAKIINRFKNLNSEEKLMMAHAGKSYSDINFNKTILMNHLESIFNRQ